MTGDSRELAHSAHDRLEAAHAAVLDGDDAAALAGIETALQLVGELTHVLNDPADDQLAPDPEEATS